MCAQSRVESCQYATNTLSGERPLAPWLIQGFRATAVAAGLWLLLHVIFLGVVGSGSYSTGRAALPLPTAVNALWSVHSALESPLLLGLQFASITLVACLYLRWRDIRRRRVLRACAMLLLALALLDVVTYGALWASQTTIDRAAQRLFSTPGAPSHLTFEGFDWTPLKALGFIVQYTPSIALAVLALAVPLYTPARGKQDQM